MIYIKRNKAKAFIFLVLMIKLITIIGSHDLFLTHQDIMRSLYFELAVEKY